MDSKKVRLSIPHIKEKKKLLNVFENILDTGFFVQSRYVEEFEKAVKEYLGLKHCVAVSSGTAALHLALLSLGIGPDDEVIVPAFTFPATVNVVELVGATPVLVDVRKDTYNIDAEQIEGKITSKTKAIMVVHLFGNPVDIDKVINIAQRYGIPTIEDAAGALGSTYNGQKCGTFGKLSCFSFHPRKLVTTAEGGAVCTNDDELAEKVRILRNHGMKDIGSVKDFVAAGFNYRMNELEAAMGLVQIEELEELVNERLRIVEIYKKLLSDVPEIAFQDVSTQAVNSYQALVLHHRMLENREIIKKLSELGVESTVGGYAIHMLSYYKDKYNYSSEDFPNAKYLHKHSFATPIYNGMKDEDIEYVVKRLKEVLKNENSGR